MPTLKNRVEKHSNLLQNGLFDVLRFSESQIEFFRLVSPRIVAFSTFRDFQKAVLQFRRAPRFLEGQTAFFRLVSRFVTKNGFFDLQRKNSCMFEVKIAQFRSKAASSISREKTAACSRLKIAQFRSKAASSIQREKTAACLRLNFAPKQPL